MLKFRAFGLNAKRGASTLETAIALPFFLLGVISLFDLFRYGYVFIVHSFAVSDIADLAGKTEMEIETDSAHCAAKPDKCADYRRRFKALLDKAEGQVNLVSKPYGQGGWFQRYEFEHYSDDSHVIDDGSDSSSIKSTVAILRPGEEVKISNGPGDKIGSIYTHPMLPYPGWPSETGRSWSNTFSSYPIVVRVQGEFKSLFGLRIPLTVESYSYRSTAESGHAARPGWGNAGGADVPPTATPVPQNGTPIPTPTATVTPTPSAAVDCSCCNNSAGCPDQTVCYTVCDSQPIGD